MNKDKCELGCELEWARMIKTKEVLSNSKVNKISKILSNSKVNKISKIKLLKKN